MKHIVDKLTNTLFANGVIEEEEKELYTYGLELLLSDVLIGTIMLCIALLTGYVMESILFCSIFYILRAYCGGYHCKSFLQCCIVTTAMYCGVLLLLPYMQINWIWTGITIGNMYVCVKYSPVQHRNRLLSLNELVYCREIARILIGVCGIVYFVAIAFDLLIPYTCISCAMNATGTFIILHKRGK